jgi:hypothetical protein
VACQITTFGRYWWHRPKGILAAEEIAVRLVSEPPPRVARLASGRRQRRDSGVLQDTFQSMLVRAADLVGRVAQHDLMALALVVAAPIAIAIVVAWARESLLRQR